MRVAGFGFRQRATPQALRAALAAAGGTGGLTLIATAEDKAAHPAFAALATMLALPAHGIALTALRAAGAAPSVAVPARYGRHSLAEAAALVAAGPGARLLGPRSISPCGLATCALAESIDPPEGTEP